MWQLFISGVDVTEKTARAEVSFSADSVSGQITVDLVDRSVIDGLVVQRVPQSLVLAYRHGPAHPVMWFFLEDIQQPEGLDAKTATLWGRSGSARLTSPWAQKVSKQWSGGNTVAGIIAEVAALCGVTVNVTNDFDVCQYCYAVSDQTPAEIIRDLATKSGQILWPEIDGTLTVAPRRYTYGTPDVTLVADEIIVESVDRTVPDFGNRILVSGDASVAGLSVQVVPMYPEDNCVPADGAAVVRLVAVVLGMDGAPVASGTAVYWQSSDGRMSETTSVTSVAMITGELQRADSYRSVRLDLPAASVVGVYDYIDYRRVRNLYEELDGSVSGNLITFGQSLKYYDQALIIDYDVAAATNEWVAGYVPGDVTITASVAGAQGSCTVHQSNPVACASQIALECVPSDACLGSNAAILAKVGMFGGPGRGPAVFSIDGCGSLSSSRKTLGKNVIKELLRTSTWGGVSQVNLSAHPAGAVHVYQPAYPSVELYASHTGRLVNLAALVDSGTQVAVEYTADGTAMTSWIPSGTVTGEVLVRESLETTDDGSNSFVTLTHLPTTAKPIPVVKITEDPAYTFGLNLYGSHAGEVVTLNSRVAAGTAVYCKYWVDQPLQPDCTATITVSVEDGSQEGASSSISVRARDCRVQSTDPDQAVDESNEADPAVWPDRLNIPDVYGPCDPEMILPRTPAPNGMNWEAVVGVETVNDCPGLCTCDQICTALRSSGELAKAGYFWSQCMAECADARARKCNPCAVTGPTELNPGEVGAWDDGRGNAGEYSGALTLVGQSELYGYQLRMPLGGEGPFDIKFCYDRTPESCCTASVDYPTCALTGPSVLEPGQQAAYSTGLLVTPTEPVMTLDGLVEIRRTFTEVVLAYPAGSCEGTAVASYGGVACGAVKHIASATLEDVGAVSGETDLLAGDTGAYYYTFSPSGDVGGLQYTGTLEYVSSLAGGAILRMPADADLRESFTASWTASCGRTASLTVKTFPVCASDVPTHGTGMFVIGDVVRVPPGVSSVDDQEYHIDRFLGNPNIWQHNECGVILDAYMPDVTIEWDIIGEYWWGYHDAWITQRYDLYSYVDPVVRYVTYIGPVEYNADGSISDWPRQFHRPLGGIYS